MAKKKEDGEETEEQKKDKGRKTKVMACSCSNASQDGIYGAGRRLYNRTAKGFRCTVCGTEKTV